MISLTHIIDAKLRQMVAMAPGQHLLEMPEVTHHREDMVLDIAEVEADFTPRRDAVLLVAALGEAFDDVRFAAEQAHEGHHLLTAFADLAQQRGEVVGTCYEDLVFDLVGFDFDRADHGFEGVDYAVPEERGVSRYFG